MHFFTKKKLQRMIHVGQYHEAGVPLFFAKRSCGVFLEHNFKVVEMAGTWRTPRRRNINILWLYFAQQQKKIYGSIVHVLITSTFLKLPVEPYNRSKYNNRIPENW
jgi:hypothetical protein